MDNTFEPLPSCCDATLTSLGLAFFRRECSDPVGWWLAAQAARGGGQSFRYRWGCVGASYGARRRSPRCEIRSVLRHSSVSATLGREGSMRCRSFRWSNRAAGMLGAMTTHSPDMVLGMRLEASQDVCGEVLYTLAQFVLLRPVLAGTKATPSRNLRSHLAP